MTIAALLISHPTMSSHSPPLPYIPLPPPHPPLPVIASIHPRFIYRPLLSPFSSLLFPRPSPPYYQSWPLPSESVPSTPSLTIINTSGPSPSVLVTSQHQLLPFPSSQQKTMSSHHRTPPPSLTITFPHPLTQSTFPLRQHLHNSMTSHNTTTLFNLLPTPTLRHPICPNNHPSQNHINLAISPQTFKTASPLVTPDPLHGTTKCSSKSSPMTSKISASPTTATALLLSVTSTTTSSHNTSSPSNSIFISDVSFSTQTAQPLHLLLCSSTSTRFRRTAHNYSSLR